MKKIEELAKQAMRDIGLDARWESTFQHFARRLFALRDAEAVPVGVIQRLHGAASISWSDRDIAKFPHNTLLFTAPTTDYKDVAERLLGVAVEMNKQCVSDWPELREVIAAAKAAGLGEE